MMVVTILRYSAETSIYIFLFYVLYHLFLARNLHFQFNRFYILSVVLIAFILPFIHLNLHLGSLPWPIEMPFDRTTTDEGLAFDLLDLNTISGSTGEIRKGSFDNHSIIKILAWLYCVGCAIFLGRYLIQLIQLCYKIKQGPIVRKGVYRFIFINPKDPSFSFLNYIFIPPINLNPSTKALICHELHHVKSKHSIDLLIIEFVIILQWWNPFIYFIKTKLIEIHEYMADRSVIDNGFPKLDYQKLLLRATTSNNPFFVSYFNHSLLKKRLTMLNRVKQPKVNVIKTGLVILMSFLIISFSTFIKADESSSIHVPPTPKILMIQDTSKRKLSDHQLPDQESFGFPNFIIPIPEGNLNAISSGYGARVHPISKVKKMHRGIDFKAKAGVDVLSAEKAIVKRAGYHGKWGFNVSLQHGKGYITRYNHMQSIKVEAGDTVQQGQIIGYVGSSGQSTAPHLHFEIWKNSKHVNPLEYLKKQ